MRLPDDLLVIAAMALATAATRFAPFLFFRGKPLPRWLGTLQHFLPPALMAVLVVYSVKDQGWSHPPFGFAALAGIAVTAMAQTFLRHTLLSLVLGTGLYMILAFLF